MSHICSSIIKSAVSKNTVWSEEDLIEIRFELEQRIQERKKDLKLKRYLRGRIKTFVPQDRPEQDRHKLIGYVEKQLYESFYLCKQTEIKKRKGLRCANYIDYLTLDELRFLNAMRSKALHDMNAKKTNSIESASELLDSIGRGARRAFYEKFRVTPEDYKPADYPISYCVKSIKNIDAKLLTTTAKKSAEYDNLRNYHIKIDSKVMNQGGQLGIDLDKLTTKDGKAD